MQIGLCLSGGGFRAAFYALGCLRYIAEAGLLPRVGAISAVSGGAIAAAAVADRYDAFDARGGDAAAFLSEIDAPFRSCVTTRNIRNEWLVRSGAGLLTGRDRGGVLAETLARHLYTRTRIADLPPGPQVIITSTDLATGRAFRVSRDFIGSFEFGYVEPPPASLSLGVAVAASAAVPVFFPPVHVRTDGFALRDAPPQLSLVDGGVYDNQGLEWFQGWGSGRPASAVECDFFLVVNASGRLRPNARTYGSLRGALRSREVQYAQTINLRTRWFVEQLINGHREGAYLGIVADPRRYVLPDNTTPIDPELYYGALPSALVRPLSQLRTDLDRFTPEEANLLSYHGYWSLHARLTSLHPTLAVSKPAWTEFADLSEPEVAGLVKALVRGRKRLRRGG